MDHLPIPQEFRHRNLPVPHLRLAPRYDRKGFEGFPERHGIRVDEVLQDWSLVQLPQKHGHDITSVQQQHFIESFLQEWLWFGLLHEFEVTCGVDMDIAAFSKILTPQQGYVLDTTALTTYVKRVTIRELQNFQVPLNLKVGDSVVFRLPAGFNDLASSMEPMQITKDLGDLNYMVEPVVGECSVIYLKRPESDGMATSATLSQNELFKTPLKVFFGTLRGVRSMAKEENLTLEEFQIRYSQDTVQISKCMQRARSIMRTLLSLDYPVLRLEVAISIDTLCSTLETLLYSITDQRIRMEDHSVGFYATKLGAAMIRKNWCPARIEDLLYGNVVEQYVFSLLPSYEENSHQSCGPYACSERPKDPSNIEPRHRTSCAGACNVITFDETMLIDVLQNGGNPGIQKLYNWEGNLTFKIVDIRERDFIAISHVFTHGLGNSKANALPLCQIEELFRVIEALGPSNAVLWIDVISVPVTFEYKRLAISKLREVYAQASKVLVIDRYLMQVGGHWLERRMQLLSCEWLRRLWTLQEGRLTDHLFIQFKDEAVPVTLIMSQDFVFDLDDTASMCNSELTTGLSIKTHFEKKNGVNQTFVDLMTDLSHRSVSFATDEPICIATLLGLKLEDFHPYPKMIDIYRSVEHIPQDVLFVPVPRLNERGFRWAPTTFLEQGPQSFWEKEGPANLDREGLRVTKDCIFINQEFEYVQNPRPMSDMYIINCHGQDRQDHAFAFQCPHPNTEHTRTLQKAAILLEKTGDRFGNTSRAILVSHLVKNYGTTYCNFEMHLQGHRVNEATHQNLRKMMARPGRQTHNVEGNFCSGVSFCVD